MNADEFRAEVEKLLKQCDKNLNIFISVLDDDTHIGYYTGYGCPGCHVNDIILFHVGIGTYKHNDEFVPMKPSVN